MINEETTLKQAINYLQERIDKNEVKDTVHKIKFMTARDVLKELLKG
ncbi:MAG: hypothetical protein P8O78_02760 [Flavobacteriaceae bacterium]|nr:hypothetical protein [Flavobacteriaceae bacterium]